MHWVSQAIFTGCHGLFLVSPPAPGDLVRLEATAAGRTQNLLGSAAMIETGQFAQPWGSGAASFIDARDIGACAAAVLTPHAHGGKAYVLTGPAAIDGPATAFGRDCEDTALPRRRERGSRDHGSNVGLPPLQVRGLSNHTHQGLCRDDHRARPGADRQCAAHVHGACQDYAKVFKGVSGVGGVAEAAGMKTEE